MAKNSTSMSRARLLMGAAAIALLGLASTETAAAQSGAQIYSTRCAACHQADGTGVPDLFPPVVKSEWVSGDPSRLIRIILHGLTGDIEVNGEMYAGTMPPWGSLSDAEIAAVSTYLRSNFGNKAPAVTAAQVAKLRAQHATRKKPWTVKELVTTSAAANKK